MSRPPPRETRWPDGAIFTVGLSTLPIECFTALLDVYGIEQLVDVRSARADWARASCARSAASGSVVDRAIKAGCANIAYQRLIRSYYVLFSRAFPRPMNLIWINTEESSIRAALATRRSAGHQLASAHPIMPTDRVLPGQLGGLVR